ncbi:MAG: hypothetical protein F4X02_04390 [Chloroflexi bacterium]|nr:hypothetical protein [Chloroflexota bacterium]
MTSDKKFKMSISLNVLNHLGIGLYSHIPPVLSEIVANAWDADATKVRITINEGDGTISIYDNGIGMSERDINERYLRVGYNRRTSEGITTPIRCRPIMGRKGIGKLSVFSIAKTVEIHSAKEGKRHGLVMNSDAIQEKIREEANATEEDNPETKDFNYYPDVVDEEGIDIRTGTLIVLRDLHTDINRTTSHLRRRLARRFSVIGAMHEFQVFVGKEEVTPTDREFFNYLEFMWYFGNESSEYLERTGEKLSSATKLCNVVDPAEGYRISGWIATVDERKNFKEYEDNINAIVIFARGKSVQDDILSSYREGGIYSKYLIGEIQADFLDVNEEPDIITSNRQNVREDAERYRKLKEFIWKQLKRIQSDWADLRKEASIQRATENPAIKKWYSKWKGGNRKAAERLFQKLESLPFPNSEARTEMYKANLVAFETLALRGSLNALDQIETEEQFKTMMRIFRDLDELEAMRYYDVVEERIAVVNHLDNIKPSALEATLQEYIYDHLWLLDPSWERAATDKRIEKSVTEDFDAIDAKLTAPEKRARLDIRYKTAAGKHIIVELKKADRVVDVQDLGRQIGKYKSALEKCLRTQRPDEKENVECIILLGKPPSNNGGVEDIDQYLRINFKCRYIFYDALIEDTLRNYKAYLEAQDEVSKFRKLLNEFTEDMVK